MAIEQRRSIVIPFEDLSPQQKDAFEDLMDTWNKHDITEEMIDEMVQLRAESGLIGYHTERG